MFYQQGCKNYLRQSVMALAIGAVLPVLAHAADSSGAAQDQASQKPAAQAGDGNNGVERLQSVEVTRKRSQTSAAVATKQTQDRVMDVVTKEQIETLPDASVTDVVKRIAGVSVSFNGDTINGRDEAQFIAIRGLDGSYNNVVIDGAPMASVDQTSRSARTNMLPASMVKEVQVFKTWQPDMDPNAVGGSVNIVTRSAFDNGGKPYLNASVALGHADGTGKVLSGAEGLGKKTDVTISNTFGPDKALGYVISANYEKENTTSIGHMTTDNIFYNYYNADGTIANPAGSGGPNTGNGIAVPQQFKYWQYQKNLERQGINAKLEAKFNPDVYGFLSLGYNSESMHERRNETFIDDSRSTGANPVSNQTQTSGQFARGEAETGYSASTIKRTVESIQSGIDWKLDDNKVLSLRSSLSEASHREPRELAKYIYANFKYPGAGLAPVLSGTPGLAMGYDTSGFEPAVSLNNPSNFTNLNNWQAYYWRTEAVKIDDRVGNLKLDYRWNQDNDSRGLGAAAGIDYRRLNHSYNYTNTQYYPTAGGMTMAGNGYVSSTIMPNSGGLPFLIVNSGAAWQQLAANGNIIAPNSANLINSTQSNYSHSEQTAAAYAMASYRTDRLSGMFGLRQDNTTLSTTGNVRNNVSGATTWLSQTNDSKYNFLLPAASLVFDATSTVKLKVAASQTIGRPNYDAYAPNTTISQNTDGTVSVTQGNPNIKPRESNNLDFSAEWYLPNSSLASLAVFDKRIKNEIYTLSSQGTLFYNGATRTAAITQPLNASSSTLNGVELNYVQGSLGWLSPYLQGLGFSGNLTFLNGELNAITSSGATRKINHLVNQPDQIRNLTVFYNYQKFGVSAAYNWTGTSLRLVDANLPSQDVYWQPRKQIDLQARYDLGSGWKAVAEIGNLTNSPVTSVTGQNRNLLKDTFSLGRTLWIGLNYAPKDL
ncbi:tonB-dependent receptor family protein [Collimonas pratensis]|uniref:TonB-dependent receptor family protein n=2 Tax=Collimonas pratensis TaxID=279113 RepID=A0A127PYA3_9BURK|nr:tonB-dependent receptor family protein [Collimonas pratensis]